jgi:rhodanese-related sulfurtransferase
MKRLIGLFIVFFLLWDLFWMYMGINPIPPWELAGRMKSPVKPPVLLDVRTAMEYRWFHIPGARNAPGLLFDVSRLRNVDKDAPIVVVCMTGHRSEIVAYFLKQEGYNNIGNLTWGMLGWKLSGEKTVSGDANNTDLGPQEVFFRQREDHVFSSI